MFLKKRRYINLNKFIERKENNYETPGGSIIYKAHEVLETICLDKDTMSFKQTVSSKFGELLYEAKWYTPLREALETFVNKVSENVNGTVTLKLYKGNIIIVSIKAENSLYSIKTASFDDNNYNQADATEFINLYSLGICNKN